MVYVILAVWIASAILLVGLLVLSEYILDLKLQAGEPLEGGFQEYIAIIQRYGKPKVYLVGVLFAPFILFVAVVIIARGGSQ